MNTGSLVGLGLGIVLLAFLLYVFIYIVNGLGYYKIFKKAEKKGWAGFVPYYNDWILVEISGCHWWYYVILIANTVLSFVVGDEVTGTVSFILSLLSLVALYIVLCINYNIARKFHQGIGFTVGMTLLPFVFYLILGFSDKYKYDETVKVNPWGLYDFEKKSFEKSEIKYCTECGSEMVGNFCPKCGKDKKGVK